MYNIIISYVLHHIIGPFCTRDSPNFKGFDWPFKIGSCVSQEGFDCHYTEGTGNFSSGGFSKLSHKRKKICNAKSVKQTNKKNLNSAFYSNPNNFSRLISLAPVLQ